MAQYVSSNANQGI